LFINLIGIGIIIKLIIRLIGLVLLSINFKLIEFMIDLV